MVGNKKGWKEIRKDGRKEERMEWNKEGWKEIRKDGMKLGRMEGNKKNGSYEGTRSAVKKVQALWL